MSKSTILQVGTERGFASIYTNGDTWQSSPFSLTGKNVVALAIAPDKPAIIFAAVQGYGVFQTEDNAASWRQVLSANAHSLLMDRANPDQLWVGVEPAGVHRSIDGGQTWHDMSDAFRAVPSALDWTYPEPPYQARVRALAQVSGAGGGLLAGIEIGGLVRSFDSGEHWVTSDENLDEDVHAVAIHPGDQQFVLAATGDGMFCSRDQGHSWEDASDGLYHGWCISTVILPSGVCLATATGTPPGPWVENVTSVLYRSEDQASFWQAVEFGTETCISTLAIDSRCLFTADCISDEVFAGTSDGSIYMSQDQGKNWARIAQLSAGVQTIQVIYRG